MARTAPGQRPEPTGVQHVRAALRHGYAVTAGRWARWWVPGLAVFVGTLASQRSWLLPGAIVAFFTLVGTGFLAFSRLALLWRCTRVVRAYPKPVFRAPVEKVQLQASERRFVLRLGGAPPAGSPEQTAACFATRLRWPEGIADGVWFCGDDAFGGVAVVPGTGDLLFMQPRNWGSAERFRRAAGPERAERARRAGLDRPVRAHW